MAINKYLTNSAGTITEVAALTTSAGAGSANAIPALDGSGRLDSTFMPTGIGADSQVITASEALAAGDFVNVWNSTGAKVRKADASVSGKEAHGYVLAAVSSSAAATVFFDDLNAQVTGLTPGVVYLSATTPGGATGIAPSGTGQTVQRLGVAVSATAIHVGLVQPIVLA
jgi:hypothetical protein